MSERLRAGLLRSVENLLILGFLAMIAMVFGNVVLRYGFQSGITMSEELSRLIFVWLTFGGAFLVAREGGHLGMTTVVLALGRRGQWWCRLAAESLSLLCMALLVMGCWTQTAINIHNPAPVSGVPLAATYLAGLLCGLSIGALNLLAIGALLRGTMRDDELVIGAESEELSAFEAQQRGREAGR
ncbi:TRAP transporter small permease [Bosea sp. (in: a-proteobacteria)]|uniref:TRAP transporter small permease n=1 Tax=Bosea sp. (in: a-proteobacteria) TaxID=1871050 RepID=UPI0027360F8B|nr:TRAP transporter small permease [Bosea sp. (in: a-proteobacteria)]MDP3410081.1 TRAP transporter small permease [Bosea sp. (in: a-proteobacteria)]